MNIAVGFAQGFQARGDENNRRRREIAEAWQQYRAQNPHATMQEMQAFIDSQTGGAQYLRGGLPSGQVLEMVAKQNDVARRQHEDDERIERMVRDMSHRSMFEERARNHVLASDDDDQESLAASFAESMGMELGDLERYGVSSFFTEGRRGQIRREEAIRLQPQVVSYLEMMGDGVENITVADLSRDFPNASRAVLDAALSGARADIDRRREAQAREEHRFNLSRRDAARQTAQTIINNVTQSQEYLNLVRAGNVDGAANLLMNYVGTAIEPDLFEDITGVSVEAARRDPNIAFGQFFEGTSTALSEGSRREYMERRRSVAPQANQAVTEAYNSGLDLIRETFDGNDMMGYSLLAERLASSPSANGLGAERLVWNSTLSSLMTSAVSRSPEAQDALSRGDTETAAAIVLSDPTFNSVAANQTASRALERTTGSLAGLEPMDHEPFNAWATRFPQEVINDDIAPARNALRSLDMSDPDIARNALQEQLQEVYELHRAALRDLDERESDDSWVEPSKNGGTHDIGRIQQIRRETSAQYEELQQEIIAAANALPAPSTDEDRQLTPVESRQERIQARDRQRVDQMINDDLSRAIVEAISVVEPMGQGLRAGAFRGDLQDASETVMANERLRREARAMEDTLAALTHTQRVDLARRLRSDPEYVLTLLSDSGPY